MKGNNLFERATSELSQDAVLLWLLKESSVNKEVLSNLLGRNTKGEKVKNTLINGIDAISEPKKQKHQVDISVEFTDMNKKKHIVLIEDKTGTELHNQQMIKYIAGIPSDYDFIHFVLFKTGVFSFIEKEHFETESAAIIDKGNNYSELVRQVLPKDEKRVQGYLDTIRKTKREGISIHLFLPDSFSDICNENHFEAEWKKDYLDYFKEIVRQRKAKKKQGFNSFIAQSNYSSEQFAGIIGAGDRKGFFNRPNNGGGRRTYDYQILGFCGKNKEGDESLRNRFYIKPIILFSGNDKPFVEASIVLHFFWQVDGDKSNDMTNYLPFNKLNKAQQQSFMKTRKVLDSFFSDKTCKAVSGDEKRLQVYKSDKIIIENPRDIDSYKIIRGPLEKLLGYCDELNRYLSLSNDSEELRLRLENREDRNNYSSLRDNR